MKKVIATTFLYDLNLGVGPGTVPEWDMYCALFTGSLRAILTVHPLCFAVFLQTREKKHPTQSSEDAYGKKTDGRGRQNLCTAVLH